MKGYKFLNILLVLFFVLISNVNAQKTVWTSDDLSRLEIESFFELFNVVSGWTNATNNDVAIQFSRNGLAGPGGAWWPVYINEAKLNQQLWNTQGLFFAPVNFNQVDSIVVVDEAIIYNSEFTEKGGVFIYNKTPDNGFEVMADVTYGNLSGDPGPFAFTELGSPNVERVGPIMSSSVSYRKEYFSIQGGFHAYYHPSYSSLLQKSRITPYMFSTNGQVQKIDSKSMHLLAEVKTGFITHHLHASASAIRDFIFTDLYGVEVPIDREWGMIAYNGIIDLDGKAEVTYKTSYSTNKAKNLQNKDHLWLSWDQQVITAGSSLKHYFSNGNQEVGLQVEGFLLEDDLSERMLQNEIFNLHHKINLKLSDLLNLDVNSKLVYSEQLALKEKVGLTINLNTSQQIVISGIYSQRLPQEDNSLWYWMAEKGFGSDTLSGLGVNELPEKSNFFQSKLGWKASFDKLNIGASAIWSANENEYAWRYQLVSNGNSIRAGNYEFINDLQASFLKIPIKMDYQFSSNIKTNFVYTFSDKLSGKDVFFSMIPAHQLLLNVNYKPVASFKIWSRIQFQSETEWEMVEPISGKEVTVRNHSETYSSHLQNRFLLDFGIRKGFWNRRLIFNLTMKNILNQNYRYNPISQSHLYTLFFGAQLNIP